jgi:predicted MFS family arabinose efflux permease
MFIVGLAIFTLASLAIGAAQSAAWMLSWRAIQGVGAAVLAPSTLALLQTNFEEGEERTRAVSWYSAAAGLSAMVGLILGGILAQWVSWRAGFYINLPIGVGMIAAARRYIPETVKHSGRFDLAGALTSTAGMAGLVYGFIRSGQEGWEDPFTMLTIGLAIVCLASFIAIAHRAEQPILPLWLFSSMQRSGAYAARVLYLGAMVGFFFFSTIYLQEVAGFGPARSGLAFLPATVLQFPFALAVPRLLRRYSPAQLLSVGMPIGIVAMGWLSLARPEANYMLAVGLPMLLIGISQGLTLSPLTIAGVAGVDPRYAGAASGAVNAAHQIGASVGLSILVSVAAIGTGSLKGLDMTARRIAQAYDGEQ